MLRLLFKVSLMLFGLTLMIGLSLVYFVNFYNPTAKKKIAESIEQLPLEHDFIIDEGVEVVISNCTACHSSKLVTQNRASREGWKATIEWMQSTQNLWPLGDNEEIILDYLSKHYSPEEKGRRSNLEDVEWYVLEQ